MYIYVLLTFHASQKQYKNNSSVQIKIMNFWLTKLVDQKLIKIIFNFTAMLYIFYFPNNKRKKLSTNIHWNLFTIKKHKKLSQLNLYKFTMQALFFEFKLKIKQTTFCTKFTMWFHSICIKIKEKNLYIFTLTPSFTKNKNNKISLN